MASRDELLAQIADAKERRSQAIQGGDDPADIEAEIAGLRAEQLAAFPEASLSVDTDDELIGLREQQVAELTGRDDPRSRALLAQFAAHLTALKAKKGGQ